MVTGGTGFIASHLVRKLVEQGENVVVFDISSNFKFIKDLADKIVFIQGDVSSFDEVIDTLKKYDIDCIYHTASLLAGICDKVPVRAVKVNIGGTTNILEASRIMDIRKVLFTSTVAIFSGAPYSEKNQSLVRVDDDFPKYPETTYGATKLLGELYGLWYFNTYGLDFRAVRYLLVYGPGDPYAYHERSRIIENPAHGKPVEIPHAPDFVSNWLYVKDTANALITLCNARSPRKRVYNIGGENRTFGEVAEIVKNILPEAIIKFRQASSPVPRGLFLDDSLAQQEIGWKPSYTLEEGIKETITETRTKNLYSEGVYIKDKII